MGVRLTLLATFRLEIDGQPCGVPTRKCEALLAYLAMRSDQSHRRDTLSALLWGDVGASQARHSLRQTIWRIKRAFAREARPVLITEGELVRLDASAIDVDVKTFERLAGSADPQDLARAAALYRGDLLEGLQLNEFRLDNWLAAERSRLHHLAIHVLTTQLQAALAADQPETAIGVASSLLALDATQEHVHRVLMRLYRQQGRPAEALQQYNLCARVLQQELAVEPDPATRQLCQEILIERARGLTVDRLTPPTVAPPPRSPEPAQTVLVLESNPLIRATFERMLRNAGYEVAVRTPAGALSLPAGASYAAVICGLGSSASRAQLLTRLRAHGYRGVVLFVTSEVPWPALSDRGGLRVEYVRRPVRQSTLLDTLRQALAATLPRRPGR
jgi:DNA-binding SARP family transcriptional activator/CheY-like chemotaxis protein